jgi:hypothetical protein
MVLDDLGASQLQAEPEQVKQQEETPIIPRGMAQNSLSRMVFEDLGFEEQQLDEPKNIRRKGGQAVAPQPQPSLRDPFDISPTGQGNIVQDLASLGGNLNVNLEPAVRKVEENVFANIGHSIMAGRLQTQRIEALTEGDVDKLAKINKQLAELPVSSGQLEFEQAKGFEESAQAILMNPIDWLTGQITTSLAGQITTGSGVVPGTVAAGAGIGAASGSLAGGVGAIPGAIAGAGIGFATGIGTTSGLLEYSGEVMNLLAENGVDIEDPFSIKKAMLNEDLMEQVKLLATAKSIPIAILDAFSVGIAGTFLKRPAKSASSKLIQAASESVVQGLLGGSGEAAGQITQALTAGKSFGEAISIDMKPVLAEMLSEPIASVPEVGIQTSIKAAFNKTKQKPTQSDLLGQELPGEPQEGTETEAETVLVDPFRETAEPSFEGEIGQKALDRIADIRISTPEPTSIADEIVTEPGLESRKAESVIEKPQPVEEEGPIVEPKKAEGPPKDKLQKARTKLDEIENRAKEELKAAFKKLDESNKTIELSAGIRPPNQQELIIIKAAAKVVAAKVAKGGITVAEATRDVIREFGGKTKANRFTQARLERIVKSEFPEVIAESRKATDTLGLSERQRLEARISDMEVSEPGRDYARFIADVFIESKKGELKELTTGGIVSIKAKDLVDGDTFSIGTREAEVVGTLEDGMVIELIDTSQKKLPGIKPETSVFVIENSRDVPMNKGTLGRDLEARTRIGEQFGQISSNARKILKEIKAGKSFDEAVGIIDQKVVKKQPIKSVIREKTGQAKPEPKLISADEALTIGLRKESKAAITGFRLGFKEASQKGITKLNLVRQQLKDKAKTITDVKESLISVVNTMLPPADRGFFTKRINRIKTERAGTILIGKILTRAKEIELEIERRNAITKLKKLGKKFKNLNHLNPAAKVLLDEELASLGIKNIKRINVKSLNEASIDDIISATEVIASVARFDKILKSFKVRNRKMSIEEAGLEAKRTFSQNKKDRQAQNLVMIEETPRSSSMKEFLEEGTQRPNTLFEGMDGNRRDGVVTEIQFNQLSEGRKEQLRIAQMAEDHLKTFLKKEVGLVWGGTALAKQSRISWGKNANKQTLSFGKRFSEGDNKGKLIDPNSAQKIELHDAELSSLVGTITDPFGKSELLKSGFALERLPERKITVTEGDLDMVLAKNPTATKIAIGVKQFLNGPLKNLLNDAWVKMHDFEVAINKNYFPVRRSFLDSPLETPKTFNDFIKQSLQGMGVFKERVGDRARPILVGDIYSIYGRHTRSVAGFIGLGEPILRAKMLLAEPNFAKSTRLVYGKQRLEFMQRRLDDITQDLIGNFDKGGALNAWFAKRIDAATKAILGINFGVVAKQPVSYLLASTEIELEWLNKGLKGVNPGTREGQATRLRMFKHSPEMWERYNVSRIQLTGQLTRDAGTFLGRSQSFGEKSMVMIAALDQMAMAGIWAASEAKVTDITGKTGGDVYWSAVNDMAVDIMRRTQPDFDLINQSSIGLSSRTNPFAKLMMAVFMNQRNQNFNMMVRAFRQLKTDPRKTAKTIALVAIAQPLIIEMIDAMRRELYGTGDEEEFTTSQKIFKGTMRLLEQNLETLYGGQVASSIIRMMKQRILTGTGRFNDPDNIVEGILLSLGEGALDTMQAIEGIGESFESGPRRGKSKFVAFSVEAIAELGIGVSQFKGLPFPFIIRLVKAGITKANKTDYEEFFKERARLGAKLKRQQDNGQKQDQKKLRRYTVIDFYIRQSNKSLLLFEKGFIDKDTAQKYVENNMREMKTVLTKDEEND